MAARIEVVFILLAGSVGFLCLWLGGRLGDSVEDDRAREDQESRKESPFIHSLDCTWV